MGERRRELVAANEPAVWAEPLLDAIVVEDSEGDRCLPDPTWTDEGNRAKVPCETNDLLD